MEKKCYQISDHSVFHDEIEDLSKNLWRNRSVLHSSRFNRMERHRSSF